MAGFAHPRSLEVHGLLRRWVRDPATFGLASLPLALIAVPMALIGLGRTAARWQVRLADRHAFAHSPRPGKSPGFLRVIGHSFAVLIPAVVCFVATAMLLVGFYMGYLYFLRPDAISAIGHPFSADSLFDTSWGGPTLAGAWLAHSSVVFAAQIGGFPLIRGISVLQARLTQRMLNWRW